jgi:two-component system, OmpR family, sensor kinase
MNSLSTRLFAAFFAIILLVITIISFALLVLLRHNPLVQRQGLERLQTVSAAVVQQAGTGRGLSVDEAASLAPEIAAANHVRVLLVNGAGEVLVDSSAGQAPPINFLRFRTARRDPAYPETLVGQVRDRRLQQWVYVARPAGGQRVLVIAAPPERFAVLGFFRENLLWPLVQAAAIALVVAALLSVLITRSVAQPLRRMASVAQGIAQGRYEQPAPATGPDEVRALGQAINSMAAQVQANQHAQRDFLANVSHELKTPLTSIQGFAQALLDGAVTTPEGVQRSANIIYTESDRLRRMVEGLLDLARLNPSLFTLNRAPVDLRALLQAQMEKFSLRAQEGGVALSAELPPTLPALVGDADRLAQVFGNLLDNALKHTPAGGRVTVSAAAVPAGVEVAVTDTGRGIPAEDLPRIFERFYQVDKARVRTAGGGVGLGLAISQEIVEAHGGRLRGDSQLGHGARFSVTLPAARPEDTTVVRKR